MVTSLNTSVPARDVGYPVSNFLRRRITFANGAGAVITIGKIPAGSTVYGGGVHVITGFDATALINIGYIGATTVPAAYASALVLSTVGYIALDELATATNIQGTVEHTVTATIAVTPTVGVADVIIFFAPANPPL